ncbi:MAG TPA: hypothetical protein VFT99_01115 [Roseiflexaceae bacterium]|nr:hypothetical protein [Roseiflexaceae bacterium]
MAVDERLPTARYQDEQRDLQAALAEYAHQAWSRWIEYELRKGMLHEDGSLTLPAHLVKRWSRQMSTAYHELQLGDQARSQNEADRIVRVLDRCARNAVG